MFKRTKSETTPATSSTGSVGKEGGKGRPTPTRKEAEAAAKARAKTPRTRREQAALQREAATKQRKAMMAGDERYLSPRDKGRVRRFIRDFVDVRFSIVEMLIPLLVVSLVLGWSGRSVLVNASSLVLMVTVLFVVVDMVFLTIRLRRQLKRRFPDESLRGTTAYAVMRSMQMKFMRVPKARLKVGQALPEDYAK